MRLDGARSRRTPKGSVDRFCWNSMPRSIVINAPYPSCIRRSNSPVVMPAQPRPTTVSTLWPWSLAAKSSGSCSSRRTRPSQQRIAREIERRDCLVAFHGWELAKTLVQGFATLEVIEQRLYWDARADEDGRAAESLRVAMHDVV